MSESLQHSQQRLRWAALLALAALTLAAPNAHAQAVYGSIAGNVTDQTGSSVPGATVTITSVERGNADTVTTNEAGFYVKDRLVPGTYHVKAEIPGFKQVIRENVVVNVDTQTKIDLKLELGQVSEQVTVTAASPLLKTDRADVATTFETRQIQDLPILDRNFTRFILLTPGTQQLQWQHAASENPQGSIQTMVNGQHFSGTGYQLDGTENRDPILGIIVINPNFEAIGETKITSQNYDAEFGQAIAGVVSIQTRSGTNRFHGSAFEFNQTDALQARNPFTQPRQDLIADTTRNEFGGSVGGPIQRDRLFFFGDFQGLRSKVGGSRRLTVPTDRARAGDFGEYDVPIFDPLSSANPNTRAQFAGNVIPANRISAQARRILDLIPRPNQPGEQNGTRNNYIASGSEIFDNDKLNARVDARVSDRLNIFGRYSLQDFFRDGPTAFGSGGGQELVSLGGRSEVTNQSIATGFDRTIGSRMTWDVRFGYFHYDVNVLPFDFGSRPAEDAGIRGLNFDTTFTSGLPALFIEGDRGFNAGSGLGVNRCNCPLDQDEKQWQIVTNVSRLHGNHTFKFGIDLRRAYNLRVPSDRHRSGELSFHPNRTSGPGGVGGLGIASFLLGDVRRLTRYVSTSTDARERQWRHFYYAQDTWRPMPKLTLNYGIRMDVISPQTINEAGNAGYLDINTGEIKVVGVGGIPLNGGVENSYNWSPRLGVTYQLTERTVLRTGYGRSYDIGVFGSLFGHSVTQNLPVLSAQELNAPSEFDRVFNLAEPAPAPLFVQVPSNGRFALPNGVFSRLLPDKQRLPSLDAWNFTVQHQLTEEVSVEIGYVGNKGSHVFAGDGPAVNINEPTLVGFAQGVPLDQRRPFFSGVVYGKPFGWTQGIDYFCNCADNRYNALQAKVVKRFSNGYSVLAHYTYQKVTQEGGSQFFFDQDVDKGPPDWDRTHNFVLSTIAELPFGRGKRWASDVSRLADALIGGWQFNQNTTIQSGLPFNVGYRTSSNEADVGPRRPNLVGDPQIDGRSRDRWFNTAPIGASGSAFARPERGTFGNLPRNHLRGPGYWRVDASLFKQFRIMNDKEIEIRIESVNVLNHVNLGNPDSTIGVLGDDNPNAGRITSTAYFDNDLQRNFQFGIKFTF